MVINFTPAGACDVEKLQVALNDEAFAKAIVEMTDASDVQAAFAAKGVELSIEDVKELGKAINAANADSEELSEADAEAVAGGKVSFSISINLGFVKFSLSW